MYLRLPTSLAAIFGSFTLGLYVAIQGPTLMDLIDLLHVNNDIMSYSLAFASLAYSVGGLLSGFLFNYVNRQILIACYLLIFGCSNIATPFISNYLLFSVITVFKMMCAGGTDAGTNVWILEMWPGKDSWLQALHFSFAMGCALGPLIVEPFLSVEYKENEMDKIAGKTSGTATINDQNNESRIHIPYGVSGLTSIFAASMILYLYYLDLRHRKRQVAGLPEAIPMTGGASGSTTGPAAASNQVHHVQVHLPPEQEPLNKQPQQQQPEAIYEEPEEEAAAEQLDKEAEAARERLNSSSQQAQQHQINRTARATAAATTTIDLELTTTTTTQAAAANSSNQMLPKITSKAKEQLVGRPPYYVMFAIALAAMCLSFYCGIEITSMNYLATFAVNIDLQLPKSTAAYMSSALTISFAVGRAFGIWGAAYLAPHKLFYLCSAIMAGGNVLMLIFANTAETLLWASICIFGVGCGPMFPAIVSFYDDKISKVTNTVSGIFILGSMFNVALNSLIIGHHIIDNALILIVCNLIGSVLLLVLFGTLHMLTKVKKNQRLRKYKLKQQAAQTTTTSTPNNYTTSNQQQLLPPINQIATNNNSNSNSNNGAPQSTQPPPAAEPDATPAAAATADGAAVALEIEESPATNNTRPQS